MDPPKTDPAGPTTAPPALAWGVIALAVALRVPLLGQQGLWADEAASLTWSHLPWDAFWARLAGDNQAPLFLLLTRGILAIVGDGEWQVRALSAASGIGAVVVMGTWWGGLLGARGAWLAAGLLAVHGTAVHYAREAKPYALLLLWWVIVIPVLHRVAKSPSTKGALLLAGAEAAFLYTHNVALPWLGVLVIMGLVAWCRGDTAGAGRRAVLLASITAAVVYLPWIPFVRSQAGAFGASYAWLAAAWAEQFPWQVPMSLATSALGAPPPIRNGVSGIESTTWILLAAQLLLVGWHARREASARVHVAALAISAVAPLMMIFAASMLLQPFHVVGRVDIPVVPLLCALVGGALAAVPSRVLAGVVPVALLAAAPGLNQEILVDTRSQERNLSNGLAGVLGRGDVLVVATAHRDTLAFYVGRQRPDVTIRAFPSAREDNAFFTAPGQPRAELEADARVVVERAAREARAAGGAHVWTLTEPGQQREVLVTAAANTGTPAGEQDLVYLGLVVHRFRLP